MGLHGERLKGAGNHLVDGVKRELVDEVCESCNGRGYITVWGNGVEVNEKDCETCEGSGTVQVEREN